MLRDTLKRLYTIHSWTGVVTAILLFVVCFTGALAVFRVELAYWAGNISEKPPTVQASDVEELVLQHAAEVDPEYLHEVMIAQPGIFNKDHLSIIFEGDFEQADGTHVHRAIWFDHHPNTLALAERREGETLSLFQSPTTNMGSFISEFHADLHLGRPLGLILTGLLGLTLLASVVTGIYIHRKILKELFTFRPFRSLRLMWNDSHKAVGVWGMLFHGTIGFTGAFLGLVTVLLVPVGAYVNYGGDQAALVETFTAQPAPTISGVPAEMQLGKVMEHSTQFHNKGYPRSYTVKGWGDQNALAYVDYREGPEMGVEILAYHLSDGSLKDNFTTYGRLGGISGPVLDAMFPLHFGNFGGIVVKILWALLGMSTGMLSLTGMILWVERRAYGPEGSLSIRTYERISRLSAGLCGGLVAACAALFPAQRLLDKYSQVTEFKLGCVFFTIWTFGTLWAMLRNSDYRATRELMLASGIFALIALPLNGQILSGQSALVVEFSIALVAILTIWAAYKLPNTRPQKLTRKAANIRQTDCEATS